MLVGGSHVDDCIAFGIERGRTDVQPAPRVAGPACRVALFGLGVQLVASRQDSLVVSGVALLRADVTDAAVAMVDVVPMHERIGPGPGLSQARQPFGVSFNWALYR